VGSRARRDAVWCLVVDAKCKLVAAWLMIGDSRAKRIADA
jgi:hypothetical protein